MAAFQKPIMISEFGSLAVGGDRKKWYSDALKKLPKDYPMVKGLIFFHYSKDNTTTQEPLDWTIINDTAIVREVSAALKTW